MESPANAQVKEASKPVKDQDASSEFAQKGPLFNKKTLIKIGLFVGLGVTFVVAVMVVWSIFQALKNRPPELNPPAIEVPAEPVAVDTTDFFAYVKDLNSIWIINTGGTERQKVFEISGDDSFISTLGWKENGKLGYSKCYKSGTQRKETPCEINVIDLTTRAITPHIGNTNSVLIRKIAFSKDQKYFAYIGIEGDGDNSQTVLYLKTGSVNTPLTKFPTAEDESNTQSRVIFTPDSQYVIFSTLRKERTPDARDKDKFTEQTYPILFAYRVNGAKVDETKGVADVFLLNNDSIAYKKDNRLIYKTIGSDNESLITPFTDSYNPAISEDNGRIAYWKNEGGFSDVVLGVYEVQNGIHRNILRGIILPTWISPDKVAGIKAEGCLGQNCLLYQYQVATLAVVNVSNAEVLVVDQGKSISSVIKYDAD